MKAPRFTVYRDGPITCRPFRPGSMVTERQETWCDRQGRRNHLIRPSSEHSAIYQSDLLRPTLPRNHPETAGTEEPGLEKAGARSVSQVTRRNRLGRVSPACVLTLASALLLPQPAFAQDVSSDRAEMDLAAGRALFQNSPLYDRIVEVRPPVVLTAAEAPVRPATPTTDPRQRPVRVILPSPYQDWRDR